MAIGGPPPCLALTSVLISSHALVTGGYDEASGSLSCQPHREQRSRPFPGRERDGEVPDPREAVLLVDAYQRAVLASPAVNADQADAARGGLLLRVLDQDGADALAAVPARDKQEVDVQFPLGGRRDVRRRDLGDHQCAEHHAVLILGDPHPGAARLVTDGRLALLVARPRRSTPLLGISARVHPLHGPIAKYQDRGDARRDHLGRILVDPS